MQLILQEVVLRSSIFALGALKLIVILALVCLGPTAGTGFTEALARYESFIFVPAAEVLNVVMAHVGKEEILVIVGLQVGGRVLSENFGHGYGLTSRRYKERYLIIYNRRMTAIVTADSHAISLSDSHESRQNLEVLGLVVLCNTDRCLMYAKKKLFDA